jgi:hypothetical protein
VVEGVDHVLLMLSESSLVNLPRNADPLSKRQPRPLLCTFYFSITFSILQIFSPFPSYIFAASAATANTTPLHISKALTFSSEKYGLNNALSFPYNGLAIEVTPLP